MQLIVAVVFDAGKRACRRRLGRMPMSRQQYACGRELRRVDFSG